jgi:hypothetical protein
MNASIRMLSLSLSSLALVATAWAQYPPAYPGKGQTQQQQADDSTACRSWAQQTTGIDPAVASQPAPLQLRATNTSERISQRSPRFTHCAE